MTHRPRMRRVIATAAGAALLAVGPGLLVAAPANAAPSAATPVLDPNYPLGGDGEDGTSENSEEPGTTQEQDPRAQRAEEFGGRTVTDLIDMGSDLLKCGLNVVAPTVKCD